MTSPQLSLICSSYAPLRSAFVVSASSGPSGANEVEGISSANAIKTGSGRDRTGKSASRGFGYVRFVLRTDAEKCLEEWGTDGGIPRSALKGIEGIEGSEGIEWDKVCGRGGIKLGWAKKKLKEGEEPEGGIKEKKPKREKVVREKRVEENDGEDEPVRTIGSQGGYDREGSRTVIVQGLLVPLTAEEIELEKEMKLNQMKVDGEEEATGLDPEEDAVANDSMVVDKVEGEEDELVPGKEVDWKKALKQKAKKWGDVESVSWPVVLPSGETVGELLLHLDSCGLPLRELTK